MTCIELTVDLLKQVFECENNGLALPREYIYYLVQSYKDWDFDNIVLSHIFNLSIESIRILFSTKNCELIANIYMCQYNSRITEYTYVSTSDPSAVELVNTYIESESMTESDNESRPDMPESEDDNECESVNTPVTLPVVEPVVAQVDMPVTLPIVVPVVARVDMPVVEPVVEPVVAQVDMPKTDNDECVVVPVVAQVDMPVVEPVVEPVVAQVDMPKTDNNIIVPVVVPEPVITYKGDIKVLITHCAKKLTTDGYIDRDQVKEEAQKISKLTSVEYFDVYNMLSNRCARLLD